MPLDKAKLVFRPFEYDWAYEAWKEQNQAHWMVDEVPLGEDVRDWEFNLTPEEKNLLTQIFRFFTQSDIEVQDCYAGKYASIFKPTEIKMMLTAFSNMESTHIDAYSHLLTTVGMPESEFSAFLEYKEMRDKHDYLQGFNVENTYEVAKTLAVFGAFIEGLQLFASFAILMNFPRFNKMKGMGQVITWSFRDESLHAKNIIRLHHAWVKEHPEIDKVALSADLLKVCKETRNHEHKFIDLAFELGDIKGLTAQNMKDYVDYIAYIRCAQLNIGEPDFPKIEENPLPWLDQLLSGQEHANFFEARGTEYSKAATKGEWDDDIYK